MPDEGLPPRAYLETLTTLDELTKFLVGRQPMGPTSRKRLQAAIEDQQDRQKLFLAALGAHKMQRMVKLLRAVDVGMDHMTDIEYIAGLKENPAELRRHVEFLLRAQQQDQEFIQQQASPDAEKHGYSADPMQQVNAIFNIGAGTADALLPDTLSTDGRRNLQGLFQALSSLGRGGGKLPSPPRTSVQLERERMIDRITSGEEGADGGADDPGT
jgi:hypothetical protein